MNRIEQVDALIAPGAFDPRWGWHDDHRHHDGTVGYLPALQQVRAEFSGLIDVLASRELPAGAGNIFSGRCLQLGLGECRASHEVWRALFKGGAVTVDWSGLYVDGDAAFAGGDTHDARVVDAVGQHGPYDFLFIDAGHSYRDVKLDYMSYRPLVRHGGVLAFHDSLARAGYPEVEVWRFLQEHVPDAAHIGTEVGIAWVPKG